MNGHNMKNFSSNLFRTAVFAFGIASAVSGTASAQTSIELGALSCKVDGQSSSIFGGSRDLNCQFISVVSDGPLVQYQGTISNVGLDLGFHDVKSLTWSVLAPTDSSAEYSLGGTYVGTTVSGSVGAGFGGNVLFGGSQNTVALQPVSVQLQTGLNATIGVVELKLNLTPGEAEVSSTEEDATWSADVSSDG